MNLFDVLVLGFIEGLTEFLPVSSTGHLVLVSRILGLADSEFLKSFEISIQVGAILAVVFLYGREVLFRKAILTRMIAGFLPAGIIGFLMYGFIRQLLSSPMVVVWALGLGGVGIILFERRHKFSAGQDDISQMSHPSAFFVGLFQVLSMIPGISRAAATIIGGEVAGLSRRAAVEFSFLLALPTLVGATGLDLMKNAGQFSTAQFNHLFLGTAVSFGVALATMRYLLRYVRTHDLSLFGWYRIIVAVLFWLTAL